MPWSSSLIFIPATLLAAGCFAEDAIPARPECNAENVHRIWTEKTDPRPSVPVEICVAKHLHYRWQTLTVDISVLRAQAKSNSKTDKDTKQPAAREAASE